MNMDFRLKVGFADHPKTRKLIRLCGEEAFRCLVRLLEYVTSYRPDGHLAGLTGTDVEIAAGWTGRPGVLIRALKRTGFLDPAPGRGLTVHDWGEHNPYAARGADRQARARQAAEARWNKARAASRRGRAETKPAAGPAPAADSGRARTKPVAGQAPDAPAAPGEPFAGQAPAIPSAPEDAPEAEFARFWAAYPRAEGREAARALYRRLRRSGDLPPLADLLSAVAEQRAGNPVWAREFPRFVPSPVRWLREGRWADRPAPPEPAVQWTRPSTVKMEPPLTAAELAERRQALALLSRALQGRALDPQGRALDPQGRALDPSPSEGESGSGLVGRAGCGRGTPAAAGRPVSKA